MTTAATPMKHGTAAPMLDVAGLSLGYQTPAGISVAVKDVNFSVRRGETAILLGPSGCGKSTILKSVAGFIKPLQGSVTVADRRVTRPGPAFGALDPQTRLRLQFEVIEVVKRTAATVLFVTHSIAEAALVGHDIIILDGSPSSVASIVDARGVSDPTSQEALEVGRQVAQLMGQEASHVIGD